LHPPGLVGVEIGPGVARLMLLQMLVLTRWDMAGALVAIFGMSIIIWGGWRGG
jgi:drug/metabolite transporter superfamily protein YnfA